MRVSLKSRVALYVVGPWYRPKTVGRQRRAAQKLAGARRGQFKTFLDDELPLYQRTKLVEMLVGLLEHQHEPKFFVESFSVAFPGYAVDLVRDFFKSMGVEPIEAHPDPSSTIPESSAVERTRHELLLLKDGVTDHRKRLTEKRNGRVRGQKPFGVTADEAETLQIIRQLRRKSKGLGRMSYQKIADRLNSLGRFSRSGKPWIPTSIAKVIARMYPHLK